MIRIFLTFFEYLNRNVVSMIGTALTTASAATFGFLFFLEPLFGPERSPYLGIITFLILPMLFVAGLITIPVGFYIDRRARRLAGEPIFKLDPERFDLNRPRTRQFVAAFILLTSLNIVLLAVSTYKGYHVMEETKFCGATCHTVMQPEYVSYLGSPHARVKCVECHIGAGADWFVKSKLSGSWQVIATSLKLYPRPIESPIKNLRPARETCEQCHWPQKFAGDKLKVIAHYKSDEKNTETKTVLLLRIGGVDGRKSHGIHWHVDPKNKIRYQADEKRDNIYDVELTKADGTVVKFAGADQPKEPAKAKWRQFDCVDCHNRPTHVFRTAADAVDLAIQTEKISRDLPFVKREGVRIVKGDYPTHEVAQAEISKQLMAFYTQTYPEIAVSKKAEIVAAGAALGETYARNVFPLMKVTWGTHPNRLGHENFPGCQRCHDGDHKTADGKEISADCNNCHTLLAQDEENPKVLEQLKP